jgi:hypothetical protein
MRQLCLCKEKGVLLKHKGDNATRVALAYVLEELKDYGLEIEINFVTLEIIIVDINSKWRS